MLQQGMQGYGRTLGYGRERGRERGGRSAAVAAWAGLSRPGSLGALPRAEGSYRRRCPPRSRSAASPAIRPLIKNPGLVMEGGQGEQRLPALPRGSAELQVRPGTPAPPHLKT